MRENVVHTVKFGLARCSLCEKFEKEEVKLWRDKKRAIGGCESTLVGKFPPPEHLGTQNQVNTTKTKNNDAID
jgi:hypothetical protein